MKFHAEMTVRGSGQLDDSRFDALADALADIEEADPDIEDADLGGSLAAGWVTASMTVEAGTPPEAAQKAYAAVRAAIHKMGDRTPGWEQLAESAGLSVEPTGEREPVGA